MQHLPAKAEPLSSRPWTWDRFPSRILVIRLHAIGDVAITLPYCVALRQKFPHSQIDFLTYSTCAGLVRSLSVFNTVHSLPFYANRWPRGITVLMWSARLSLRSYDVVLDLQHNWVSTALRRAAHPTAWAEFHRTEPKSAGERTQDVLKAAGLSVDPAFRMPIASELVTSSEQLLKEHGWDGRSPLVVLNPAGLFVTRNWPLENYLHLAKLWLQRDRVQFLVLGTERIRNQSAYLKSQLQDSLIDLVGCTSLSVAFATLQHASAVVSEDSGLMHMAWVSGIPTVALLGSSRHDWSRPLGPHSSCLHSGDLECGACMQPTCKYGDVHCLARYTPEQVYDTIQTILKTSESSVSAL
jgi:heptosyltransferase-2